jgi:hypothetical protein
MTDDVPEHDPDPDHDCPVCSAKRGIMAMLRADMATTLRELIAECVADVVAGKQTAAENAEDKITVAACMEMLDEMGEPFEADQQEGTVH